MAAPMVVYTNSIPGGFTTGRQMTIRGSTTPGCQRFGIRLTSGTGQARDDIAMFMEVRFDENCVVKNSYISERWGHEERVALPPIARGQPFQIVIANEPSMYRILVDGRPAADFAHRVPSERVQHVLIDGSVKVDYVTFDGSSGGYPSGPGSYMPPPVAPSTPSMYPPMPGSVGFSDGAPSGPPLVGFGSSGPGYPASSPVIERIYPPRTGPGYPGSSGPGYPASSGPGYPASSGPGYPPSSGPGYPPTGPGYPLPTSSSSPGYPSSGPGYPSAPGAPQYGGPPTTGYPPYGAPSSGYPSQQPGGYPPQQPGGYPAGYPPQAGYPPSAPGYPQQTPGYPQQQPGSYASGSRGAGGIGAMLTGAAAAVGLGGVAKSLGGQGHGYGHGPSHGKGGVTGAIQAGVAALGIGGHRSAPGMHTASHGPGMGTMGVLGAGAAAAVLGPKLLKKNKKQKKLLKYGLPAAALGTGAYAMHRGFHRRSSSSSSSSSSSGSEEDAQLSASEGESTFSVD